MISHQRASICHGSVAVTSLPSGHVRVVVPVEAGRACGTLVVEPLCPGGWWVVSSALQFVFCAETVTGCWTVEAKGDGGLGAEVMRRADRTVLLRAPGAAGCGRVGVVLCELLSMASPGPGAGPSEPSFCIWWCGL